mmetsp:Transcript_3211/g.3960  ORF Transcript_3211/g.3960 Transcript_3211/m.3960 type:complete len:272 (-) Transcript_3211:313-1128(-)
MDVFLSSCTSISTSNKDRNTHHSNLLETNIGVRNIRRRTSSQLTTSGSLTNNRALIAFSPTIRNGENKRVWFVVSSSLLNQSSEIINPSVNNIKRCWNSWCDTHDVLNIQSTFHINRINSNKFEVSDCVGQVSRSVSASQLHKLLKIVDRNSSDGSELDKSLRTGWVTCNIRRWNTILGTDSVRNNIVTVNIISLFGVSCFGWVWKVGYVGDENNNISELFRDSWVDHTTVDDRSSFSQDILERMKFGLKSSFNIFNSTRNLDKVTIITSI